MVTCRLCGKLMAKDCNCFDGLEYTKEYSRLANNETRVIESVRNNSKKLFIISELTGVKKQAKISKLAHFGISAKEKFEGSEISNSPFFMRLEEENGDLVYRRIFNDKLDTNDSIEITWILEAKRKIDKLGIKFLGKIFKGRGKTKNTN